MTKKELQAQITLLEQMQSLNAPNLFHFVRAELDRLKQLKKEVI